MITLNLIPNDEKKELRMLSLYVAIKNVVFLSLFGTILIAITLLSAKFILNNYFNATVDGNYLTIGIGRFSVSEVKEFKEDLREIIKIQNSYHSWYNFFIKINGLINKGITLNTFSVSESKIKLNGTADSRDDLINLKNNLVQSKIFKDFEIPLNVLFKKENINFNLDLELNIDINKL